MAERTNASSKQSKKASNTRPPAHNLEQAIQPEQLPENLADLPAQSNARTVRQDAVLRLQRRLGNNYVQRQIARQADEEGDVPVSAEGLGLEAELEGHPFGPVLQREDEAGDAPAETLAADVTLELKAPAVKRPTEKQIQDKHGVQGIAGYTKPTIKFAVPEAKKYSIKVKVIITFAMDLASEYTGGRLQVLRDHEDSHILIAEKVANEHVIKPLKSEIEALKEFNSSTKPKINPMFNDKYQKFKDEEKIESDAFDAVDYPRMKQAYLGVKTSLANLAAGSAKIKTMSAAMDAFNNGAAGAADADSIGKLTKAVADAQAALSADDLARLQYNEEFKGKVSTAQGIVSKMTEKPDALAEGVKAKLDELSPILDKFTWQPVI